jgi:hypothetical protein
MGHASMASPERGERCSRHRNRHPLPDCEEFVCVNAPSARCGQELALQMLDRPAALAFHVQFCVFAMRGSANGKLLDGRSHLLSDVRV